LPNTLTPSPTRAAHAQTAAKTLPSADALAPQQAVDVVDDVSSLVRSTLRRLEAALQNAASELQSRSSELAGLQQSVSKQQARKISFCE
jgi:hypothetical protein